MRCLSNGLHRLLNSTGYLFLLVIELDLSVSHHVNLNRILLKRHDVFQLASGIGVIILSYLDSHSSLSDEDPVQEAVRNEENGGEECDQSDSCICVVILDFSLVK